MKKTLHLRPGLFAEEEVYIRDFLSTYKLSPTDLNKFLEDPRQFLRDAIFRYPFEENEFTIFGKTYHKALELFYAQYKSFGEVPDVSWLKDIFRTLLNREILSPETREKLLEKGIAGLGGWYDLQKGNFHVPIELELNFYPRNILLNGIPLTGKIDKVEALEAEEEDLCSGRNDRVPVTLIDYKTGRTKTLGEIKGTTQNSEGNYLRQLIFYKIMFDLDTSLSRQYSAESLAIEFVEGKDGKYAMIPVDFTQEDIERVKNEIQDSWEKMHDMDFWKSLLMA